MPDTPKNPEQSTDDQSPEKVRDLPDKAVNDRDAQSVKGGKAEYLIIKRS